MVAILALLAAPSFQDQIIRDQINKALPLADIAKAPTALAWSTAQAFPADNASAGLPPADKIVNNYISSVQVQDGAMAFDYRMRPGPVATSNALRLMRQVGIDVVPLE